MGAKKKKKKDYLFLWKQLRLVDIHGRLDTCIYLLSPKTSLK